METNRCISQGYHLVSLSAAYLSTNPTFQNNTGHNGRIIHTFHMEFPEKGQTDHPIKSLMLFRSDTFTDEC